jgi:hypothetical protein
VNQAQNTLTRFQNALASKWTARIGTVALLSLALFFSHPNSTYRSYFRQLLFSLGAGFNSDAWNLIRNVTYVFFLASAILLTALFLKKARNNNWAKEILAINCAWTAFLLQASLMFGLQWEAFDVWITMSNIVEIFFWATIILTAASLLLLAPFKPTRWFGYFVSWALLIGNSVAAFWVLKYWVLYSNPFPSLTVAAFITNIVALYSFHSKYISNTRLLSRFKASKGNLKQVIGFATSPKVFSVLLALILLPSSVAFFEPYSQWARSDGSISDDFYVGVSFCGRTVEDAKCLIDKAKDFTNVFVVQSLPISYNEAALNEICDYAVSSELSIIVYFSIFEEFWQINWLDSAEARWGSNFLGVYLYDEPGGLQVDQPSQIGGRFRNTSYEDAAQWFFDAFWNYRTRCDLRMLKMRAIKTYVSDYALYWFDYEVGYDCVFVQFGWNHSRPLHVALCRGAANMHERDWGAIITWTYSCNPYLESGDELYDDLVLAYDNGANYALVFNYPYASNSTYGILEEEHFEAISRFWDFTKQNSRSNELTGRVAYVLPEYYGYGFRGLDDNIWGRFEADSLTPQIYGDVNKLLMQFGSKLDIIYDDKSLFDNPATERYSEILKWNETT